MRAARVEEIAAARRQRLFGETIRPRRLVRLGPHEVGHEQPVRVEDHGLGDARGKQVIIPILTANRRAAPDQWSGSSKPPPTTAGWSPGIERARCGRVGRGWAAADGGDESRREGSGADMFEELASLHGWWVQAVQGSTPPTSFPSSYTAHRGWSLVSVEKPSADQSFVLSQVDAVKRNCTLRLGESSPVGYCTTHDIKGYALKPRKSDWVRPLPKGEMSFSDWLQVRLQKTNLAPFHLALKTGFPAHLVRSWAVGTSQPAEHQREVLVKFFRCDSHLDPI